MTFLVWFPLPRLTLPIPSHLLSATITCINFLYLILSQALLSGILVLLTMDKFHLSSHLGDNGGVSFRAWFYEN